MAGRLSLSRLRLNPNYNALSKFHAGEGSDRLRVEADGPSSYEEILQICRHLDLEHELLPSPAGAAPGFRRLSVRRGNVDELSDDGAGLAEGARKLATPMLESAATDGQFGPAPAVPRKAQKRPRAVQEAERLLGVYTGPSGLSAFYRSLTNAFPGQNELLAKGLIQELRIAVAPHLRKGVSSSSSDSSSSSSSDDDSSDSSASTGKRKKRKAKKKAKKKKKKEKRKAKKKKRDQGSAKLEQEVAKEEQDASAAEEEDGRSSVVVALADPGDADELGSEAANGTAPQSGAPATKSDLSSLSTILAEAMDAPADAPSVPDSDIEARHLASKNRAPRDGEGAENDGEDSEIWSDAASDDANFQ